MSSEPDILAPTLCDKIRARHCDRQAVVYVRQSTLRQIEHNRESTRLQYALTGLASRNWRASHEAGGSPCPTHALQKSFGTRLCGLL
jgi:hypothetical protein